MNAKMVFKTESLKADREGVCQSVLYRFDLPALRLLCYFDDVNPANLEIFGKPLYGFHAPVMSIDPFMLPRYVEGCIAHDGHGKFVFDNLIYVCGRACATDIGTVITLAHELQHFVQHGNDRKVWDANSRLREKFQSMPWRLPCEREAMISSKRVAEVLFGKELVAKFAEARIAEGESPQKWEFFSILSVSETCSLREETEKLIEALRGSCKGPDSLVEARERDHMRDERSKSQKLSGTRAR
jgi:hypothetical protein